MFSICICKKCFEILNVRKEALRHNIDELKFEINFIKLSSPIDPTIQIDTFTDVVLIPCSDSSSGPVHAHKIVLGSHSPVFKAMFQNYMKESKHVIKVADVSYVALRAFVNYLYTAEVCLENQMAFGLFIFAKRYQVNHLKAYCEKFLIAELNEVNAISTYTFSKEHNAKRLLDSTLTWIVDNKEQFVRSEAYVKLKRTNPGIVADILEDCFSNDLLILP
ncbi:hypothetical protein RIF29_09856 [Crotalaria pallida]|uniref:BTB domain-containing protein n=1 Tax=Crotalaria pallida TaxID=3830 RepID=A0AAN9FSB3_CROPI